MSEQKYVVDPALKNYATSAVQLQCVDAVNEHGSYRKAGEALGKNNTSVMRCIDRLKEKAAREGYIEGGPTGSMFTETGVKVPPGYLLRGTSTLVDAGGKPIQTWIKTKMDYVAQQQAMREAAEAMAEELPRLAALPLEVATMHPLCNLYTVTDYHVGMLAWGRETGAPWDLKIAEDTLIKAFEQLILASPPASRCIVNQLGDFLHYDGLLPVTPEHGHVLDSDGRFSKMVGTAIRLLRRVIDMALLRHAHVTVLLAEGNHDMASSVWLRHMFKALYENETRVTVIDSELPYYAVDHGKTMLAFHHGHLQKNAQLPLLFAAQFPQMWGRTTKRYAHSGHRHHVEEKEHSGMKVFQHPTLAARDAYAARGGWIAERQISSVTYHEVYGETGRNTITPEMLG